MDDTASQVSDTDCFIFSELAKENIEKDELSAMIQSLRPSPPSSPTPSVSSSSRLQSAIDQLQQQHQSFSSSTEAPPPAAEPHYHIDPPTHRSTPQASSSSSSSSSTKQVDWDQIFKNTQYVPKNAFNDINVEEENNNPQTRREKQEILFQLLKDYKDESVGQWTMDLPLFELKYELSRRQEFKDEKSKIEFMRSVLKGILTGLEFLNKKFGPLLELDGWAKEATEDMSKYDRALIALYHKYFKRKQLNPIAEILWLILGSMALYHIQHKYLGGGNSKKHQAQEEFYDNYHDIDPPPQQQAFNKPGRRKNANFDLGSILKLFAQMGR